ncbi:MAG TPA: kelch repeat-containing protein [Kofleriaceae bacterium]
MTRAIAIALGLAACSGETGTVSVSLVTAPGSTVLAQVQTLQLRLTNPDRLVSAQRTATGFDLSLELDASDRAGAVVVTGLDAAGAVVAVGQSPVFPLGGITAAVVVYVAPPMSIAPSPASLGTARSEVAGSALSYGAVLAGGRDGGGAPTTDIGVYNAYDHTLIAGAPLPAARAGLAMTSNTSSIYLFGGTGPDGNPTGTLWLFDTTVAPAGAFTTVADQPAYARTGQRMLTIPAVGYPITGAPGLLFDGSTIHELSGALPPVGGGGITTSSAVFVGDDLIRLEAGALTPLAGMGRPGAAATTRSDGKVLVVGGGEPQTLDGLIIDPAAGTVVTIPGALTAGRSHPAIAATSRHLVVAGGTDASGAPIASAEILDVTSLAPITTVAMPAATGRYAIALPDDQVLLTGGAPATSDILLFTPPPP